MTQTRRMRQLHRIRKAQEEQSKSAMASAIQKLRRLESARTFARERASQGRELLYSGESTDRIAGQEEIAAVKHFAEFLTVWLQEASEGVENAQNEFLARRVEQEKVRTLLEFSIEKDVGGEKRRLQMVLDDWHRARRGFDRRLEPRESID